MLLPRLLTAFVGIPLVLGLIHLGSLPFLAFVLGVVALAAYEYAVILRVGRRGSQLPLVVLGSVILAGALALGGPSFNREIPASLASAALSAIILASFLWEVFRRERSFDRAALSLAGTLLVGWGLGHLALLRDLRPNGEAWTFCLVAAVWAMDTAAYAAGHAVGRAKLAPSLSPKKTWEGAIAGFAAAVGVVFLFRARALAGLSAGGAAAVGAVIGTLGQLSDLAESMIKRAAGVKDSANLLPGHGGVLDRFDSFLLSAPAVYYTVLIFLGAG